MRCGVGLAWLSSAAEERCRGEVTRTTVSFSRIQIPLVVVVVVVVVVLVTTTSPLHLPLLLVSRVAEFGRRESLLPYDTRGLAQNHISRILHIAEHRPIATTDPSGSRPTNRGLSPLKL